MHRMIHSRRAWVSGLALAALVAGAVVASPLAGAHPDPLETSHKQQATGGIVVQVSAPSELAGELPAVQWGDTGPIEGQSGELVYAGSGCSPLSYAGVDVAGKIAFIESGAAGDPCPVSTFLQRVQSAEQAGAIALVALPAEGAEPTANATAVTSTIPAVELYRTPEAVAVRDAVVAGAVPVEATLADTREPLPRIVDQPCVEGMAGPFPCEGIDLLSFVPQEEFDGAGVSDIWGWTDAETGREYVLFGKTNGVAIYDVTDPYDPTYLGELPNEAVLQEIWHDIKVFEDHAFIVSESMPHGMTVFDLTQLRGVTEPRTWTPTARYDGVMSAHNIAINEDTGFAYIVGGNAALVLPDQCLSGLHMVDINDPANPTFAGCHPLDGGPGTAARTVGLPVGAAYVHDTQCVVYRGPDADHQGREVCFNAAEDKVAIVDVTDKPLGTKTIATVDYEAVAYAHQGWLTEDHRFLLTNDELDETSGEEGTRTRTIVLDVQDLDAPVVRTIHHHDTVSIDHNNYVHEGRVYQSNYTSGLRVLDVSTLYDDADPRLDHQAFFDVYPYSDDRTFDGTWSNYPYFGSGTIAVTGIGEGLFLVRLADSGEDDGAVTRPGKGRGNGPPPGRGPKP